MGEQEISQQGESAKKQRRFMQRLLNDLALLEKWIDDGLIESGIRRIGAEQEFFLVDSSWQPVNRAMQILERIGDPRFTTELAQFNLEANLDPVVFEGNCLSRMEAQLSELIERLHDVAQKEGALPLLTGILPTLQASHLELDHMTPMPRYRALNSALLKLSGGPQRIHIKGTDELIAAHNSVMLEACNTSFQLHFQVAAEEFASLYNIAQLVTAPLLAASCNSPLLFGKRLWSETRIALFQQAVDTRSSELHLREMRPRVNFGNSWIKNSVLEIFREDVARFRVLLALPNEEEGEPSDVGQPPQLRALRLHNGTIYRWNRPCYGISDGKAHLRIENRVLPSGPTPLDEMANAAFFFGLMCGISSRYDDVTPLIEFPEVKANFVAAARLGLRAQFKWIDGETKPAKELIGQQLLPMAHAGLIARKIDRKDADRFLEVVDRRVASRQTGAQWMVNSLASMGEDGKLSGRLAALTAATYSRQRQPKAGHEWPLATLEEAGGWKPSYMRVEQYMTRDLFTVQEDDSIDLVANLMDWERIRHVPVEDHQHRLVGLISYRSLLRYLARQGTSAANSNRARMIMKKDVVTVGPETSTLEAMGLMRRHQIGCLPVLRENRLIGIVTERDFMEVASQLVEKKLRE